jgi:hypothetical protein
VATKEKILRDLYMALDEMNFMSNKAENGGWFEEKLDKNVRKIKLFNSFFFGQVLFNSTFIMMNFIFLLF